MNIDLNLLQFQEELDRKKEESKRYIFDPIRKKYLVETPEELVRQLLILHLLKVTRFPKSYIAVEKELIINERQKRFDLLVYNSDYQPLMLIECKSPKVKLSDNTFRQAACYNFELKADYLIITNGISTYCCQMDYNAKTYWFLAALPSF